MRFHWKTALAAASILLLIGAGCEANVKQSTTVDTGADQSEGMMKDEGDKMDGDSLDASVDASIDAALNDVDADASTSSEADSDVDAVNNDGAELDAYGKAYDKNEL